MHRHVVFFAAALALSGCSVVDDMQFWENDKHETAVPPPPISTAPTSPTAAPAATAGGGVTVMMNEISISGVGTEIGTLTLADTSSGLSVTANLADLEPGDHGFHIHQNANCSPAGKDGKMMAGETAGGHFDPLKSGKHLGPSGNGHKGDMPVLTVDADGTATATVVVPHLTLADVHRHAIVIHEGGDNFSDKPKPNGGGGNRIACGIIP